MTMAAPHIVVQEPAWAEAAPDIEALIARAIAAAAAVIGREAPRGVAVALVCDADQRALNARHRGKDASTNVLAFPAAPEDRETLGDIVLALETISGEAEARGLSLSDHVAHLAIHGFLHLLGYDHDDDQSAAEMEELETRALAAIGVRDPYGEMFNA